MMPAYGTGTLGSLYATVRVAAAGAGRVQLMHGARGEHATRDDPSRTYTPHSPRCPACPKRSAGPNAAAACTRAVVQFSAHTRRRHPAPTRAIHTRPRKHRNTDTAHRLFAQRDRPDTGGTTATPCVSRHAPRSERHKIHSQPQLFRFPPTPQAQHSTHAEGPPPALLPPTPACANAR